MLVRSVLEGSGLSSNSSNQFERGGQRLFFEGDLPNIFLDSWIYISSLLHLIDVFSDNDDDFMHAVSTITVHGALPNQKDQPQHGCQKDKSLT